MDMNGLIPSSHPSAISKLWGPPASQRALQSFETPKLPEILSFLPGSSSQLPGGSGEQSPLGRHVFNKNAPSSVLGAQEI